jgi:predicted LPLAT superfamily acyltransferase
MGEGIQRDSISGEKGRQRQAIRVSRHDQALIQPGHEIIFDTLQQSESLFHQTVDHTGPQGLLSAIRVLLGGAFLSASARSAPRSQVEHSGYHRQGEGGAAGFLHLLQVFPQLDRLIGRRSSSRPLDDAMAAGNGAILISPHLGNWELGGLALAARGYKMNVLTFREPDAKVNELREAHRRRRGINFIYVDRDDTSPLAIIEAVNALRRNEVLALLGDRDGSSHTAVFDFFNRPAQIPVGAAYLALASGAPVIPVFVPLAGRSYDNLMEEPIWFRGGHADHVDAIRSGTESLLRVFERYIRAYPDQWYNFYDYWGSGVKRPATSDQRPVIKTKRFSPIK